VSCLFCQGDVCTDVCKPMGPFAEWLSRFGALKGRRARLVQRGLHPTGFQSGPEGKTCGDCDHLVRVEYAGTYLKCGLDQARWTRGPGTDLRVRWPACERLTEKES